MRPPKSKTLPLPVLVVLGIASVIIAFFALSVLYFAITGGPRPPSWPTTTGKK